MISINNITSVMGVHKHLDKSTNILALSLERMSTGYKVNSAKDDAAGMFVASGLNSRLRGLKVATSNVNNAISLLNTGECSLKEITTILNRIRDLAVQSSSNFYDESSRQAFQDEADSLLAQLGTIRGSTLYNAMNIFDGSAPPPISQSGSVSGSSGAFISQISRISEADAIAQGYTVIKTAEDFDKIRDDLGGKYMLMGHIDLSGFDNWDPIGDSTNKFTGVLDGNGFSVYNLKIDRGSEDYVGLFGYADGAEFKNLGVQGADINGNKYTGGLIGYINNGKINNCYNNICINTTSYFCGGITGVAENSILENIMCNINATGDTIGGISGGIKSNTTITNCYTIGNILGLGSIGGIVGQAGTSSTDKTKIQNSYSLCSIEATATQIGGIVGANVHNDIENCYFDGTIKGLRSVGGIAGYSFINSTISTSYSLGTIVGDSFLGGIVGSTDNRTGNALIENCHSSANIFSTWTPDKNYFAQSGGIVGNLQGEAIIRNCYSSGNVNSLYSCVGGGFGAIDDNTQVYNCFSTGKVICYDTTTYPDEYGGLYGQIEENASIYNSYWNKDTSGMDNAGSVLSSHAGTIENVEGLTSAQMDKEFVKTTLGWDEAIWDFSGGLPVLKNLPSFGAYFVPTDYRRFQVAEMGNEYSMLLVDTTLSLDLSGINLLTEDTSTATIEKIDELLKVVLRKQSDFGVAISQLESIKEKNDINIQNITASVSTIMDTDMAQESANYVKHNILSQTASSLLSQASSMNSNTVLTLINSL